MRCDVCRGPIKPQLNVAGTVSWDKGHNPDPFTVDNLGKPLPKDARCCDSCEADVLLARILDMRALERKRSYSSGCSSVERSSGT